MTRPRVQIGLAVLSTVLGIVAVGGRVPELAYAAMGIALLVFLLTPHNGHSGPRAE